MQNSPILELYHIVKELGSGSFSVVYEVNRKSDGITLAIKVIRKRLITRAGLTNLFREIEILKNCSHPNIAKLVDLHEDKEHIFMVTEFFGGGELFQLVSQKGKLSEESTKVIVKQVLSAVDYLHSNGVAHRDLKLENLLLSTENSRVAISDFGLAKLFIKGNLLTTTCGTPAYAAPELVETVFGKGTGIYDKEVDMWAVGVITYTLLCGTLPFGKEVDEYLFDHILKGTYELPNHLSHLVKDFISNLLMIDPNLRSTSSQCLTHPWIA